MYRIGHADEIHADEREAGASGVCAPLSARERGERAPERSEHDQESECGTDVPVVAAICNREL